jgi:hypothetical protein
MRHSTRSAATLVMLLGLAAIPLVCLGDGRVRTVASVVMIVAVVVALIQIWGPNHKGRQ